MVRRERGPLCVLIIGGTRFMGPHVVRYLCRHGCQVAVFHRGQTGVDSNGDVTHILGDRHRLGDSATELRRYAPQVVLDMVPLAERDARDLVRTFTGIAQRVVAISSQDVYRAYGKLTGMESGPPDPIPLTEDAPLRTRLFAYRGERPRGPEDPRRWLDEYEKILVERTIMGAPDLPGTVLRLPMVYGPEDAQHRLFEYLQQMDDGRPEILLGERVAAWRWTRGYVENVAAAIALSVLDERAASRIYNVGEATALSTAEWVGEIGLAAGWQGQLTVRPEDELPAELRPDIQPAHHLVADTSRIRRELGYVEDVPRDEALRRSVAWERANPPPVTPSF
jgi:nucleoside-diphosphate-sugar epimerase